ncbi:MAG: right-handed parallel beta-helix repeat-containing protein [Phycisphaerales bacterium]
MKKPTLYRGVPALVTTLAVGALALPALAGDIYYVRTSGNDSADGRSPETALASIQAAIGRCSGSGNVIYVGPGEYFEEINLGRGHGSSAPDGVDGDPNRIVGDITGAETTDGAGPVIVNGDLARHYGIRVQNTDHWSFEKLTFDEQRSYGVHAKGSQGIAVVDCVINVPSGYGAYFDRVEDLDFLRNRLVRDDSSGHSILAYSNSGTMDISGNRMSLTGDMYLSTWYTGAKPSRRRSVDYGIIAYSYARRGNTSRIRITNNVVSDNYVGIYGIGLGDDCETYIANNSVAGCRYGIYGFGYRGSVTVADNIVSDCYYGAMAYRYRGNASISGLLTYNIGSSHPYYTNGCNVSGVIIDEDPQWRDPYNGNFSLLKGSPAIDSGTAAVAVYEDIRGVTRPYDGDDDSTPVADLGAYEYHPSFDGASLPRVVSWREDERR